MLNFAASYEIRNYSGDAGRARHAAARNDRSRACHVKRNGIPYRTLIENFHPDAVINTGIAGGTGGGAGVLDVVIGREVAYHDVWCGPGNAPGQVQGHPERYEGATALFDIRSLCADPNVKIGLIASGDKFVSTPGDLEAVLRVQPEAVAVDMESGAIAQVCHLRNVPFLAIRVVSDTPGVENHLQQYGDFWSLAPKSTFGVLRRLLSA